MALQLSPHYADSHYNLADIMEELGLPEARTHWQAYLCQDRHSSWAQYARLRLGQSRLA